MPRNFIALNFKLNFLILMCSQWTVTMTTVVYCWSSNCTDHDDLPVAKPSKHCDILCCLCLLFLIVIFMVSAFKIMSV